MLSRLPAIGLLRPRPFAANFSHARPFADIASHFLSHSAICQYRVIIIYRDRPIANIVPHFSRCTAIRLYCARPMPLFCHNPVICCHCARPLLIIVSLPHMAIHAIRAEAIQHRQFIPCATALAASLSSVAFSQSFKLCVIMHLSLTHHAFARALFSIPSCASTNSGLY